MIVFARFDIFQLSFTMQTQTGGEMKDEIKKTVVGYRRLCISLRPAHRSLCIGGSL